MNMKQMVIFFCGFFLIFFNGTYLCAQQAREIQAQGNEALPYSSEMSACPLLTERFINEGDYFLVRGKKVFLRKDTGRVVVKLKPSALSRLQGLSGQTELQNDFVRQTLNLATTDGEPVVEKEIKNKGLAIIATNERLAPSAQELRSRIQAISATDSVEYAYPVFISKTTFKEIIPTDEILVRFSPDFGQVELEAFCSRNDLSYKRKAAPKLNILVLGVNTPKYRSILNAANSLNGQPGVVWAQPNFIQRIEHHSVNDPLYPDQWHLENTGQGGENTTEGADVDAEEAWAIQTGSPDITIAIVDDGVDLGHEDLDIWTNPGEIAGNGIDDDGNGYVDDIHGWNFSDNNNNPDADSGSYHGTACAGVAAAKGDNGIGVAGIAYGSKILPVKISEEQLETAEGLANAILYAADQADVISCSWSSAADSENYIMDAIDYAVENGRNGKGAPIFFSTGNGSTRGGRVAGYLFSEWPAGNRTVAWQFVKNDSGGMSGEGAWLDDIVFVSNDDTVEIYESFEEAIPPHFPDEDWFTSGDAVWQTVADPFHAVDMVSIKSGTIGNDQLSFIGVSKNVSFSEGYLAYRVWVEAAPGDFLVAGVRYGDSYRPYETFVGEGIFFPANYSNTIAVGASDDSDIQCYYSQYGQEIDFVAPSSGGELEITTTDRTDSAGYDPTNYTDSFGGTSSAAPLAAGIAALLLSKDPDLTAAEIRAVMQGSCDKIGSDTYDNDGRGWNMYYGYGRVNAHKALLALGQNATLTISSSAGGSVTTPGEGDFSVAYGEVVDLVASPDKGFKFQNWTGDVEDRGDSTTTIAMNGDKEVSANFTKSGGSGGGSGGCFITMLIKG